MIEKTSGVRYHKLNEIMKQKMTMGQAAAGVWRKNRKDGLYSKSGMEAPQTYSRSELKVL